MRYRSSESGLATLMFTVVLLFAITSITFLTAKTLLTEQKIAGNDYKAKELAYAGEAALEYGIGWLNDQEPDFASWNSSDEDLNGTTYEDLSATNTSLVAGTDSYSLTVLYIRSCLVSPNEDERAGITASNETTDACRQWLIHVSATASAAGNIELSRTLTIRLLENRLGAGIEYIRVPGSWRDW